MMPSQTTYGSQSPTIGSGCGDVNVIYNVPQKAADGLQELLDAKLTLLRGKANRSDRPGANK
jgi:hypothetical protein